MAVERELARLFLESAVRAGLFHRIGCANRHFDFAADSRIEELGKPTPQTSGVNRSREREARQRLVLEGDADGCRKDV